MREMPKNVHRVTVAGSRSLVQRISNAVKKFTALISASNTPRLL